MKRCLLLVLLLLFLTSGVSCGEESTASISHTYRMEFTEARQLIDAYQEKYGVVILFGEECQGVTENKLFSIGEDAPAKSPFLGMLGYKAYKE